MDSPFDIDESIARAAESAGVGRIERRRRINVDRRILPPFYWTKKPDYHLIERHLMEGKEVPGASLAEEIEYTLSKPQEPNAESR